MNLCWAIGDHMHVDIARQPHRIRFWPYLRSSTHTMTRAALLAPVQHLRAGSPGRERPQTAATQHSSLRQSRWAGPFGHRVASRWQRHVVQDGATKMQNGWPAGSA
jgi:hypothetical protein